MIRILDIARKDLTQILRDRRALLFLLVMPIAFTLFFTLAFGGGFTSATDNRLPVGLLDRDQSAASGDLAALLGGSTMIRVDADPQYSEADLDRLVADQKLAAAVVVPAGYGESLAQGSALRLAVIADPSQLSTRTVEGELQVYAQRMTGAARIARIAADAARDPAAYDPALADALAAWLNPPIGIAAVASGAVKAPSGSAMSAAHSSPGMMLQFAIAGLMTAAGILVNERKSRSLQRLLTTAASRVEILLGHYLAVFTLILGQFVILMVFGDVFLHVGYLSRPAATFPVAAAAAACIAALGLLIGVLAKTEEQSVILVMVPMFVLSGLGGAWMPLEYTGAAFRAVGHLSPVAWAMDGFENIVARGLGFPSVLLPIAALAAYAAVFFALAVWRFWKAEG